MSYAKNIASNFITQIMIMGFSFITSLLITRQLGPSGKGDLAYLTLIISTISEYGHLGITYSLPYFYKKSKSSPQDIFNTNILTIIAISLVITMIIIGWKIGGNLNYSWLIIGIMIVTIIGSLFANLFTSYYVADEKIYMANNINLKNTFMKTAVLLVLVFTGWLNLISYLGVQLIFILITIPLLFRNVRAYKLNLSSYDKKLLIEQLKFGGMIYLGNLFVFLNYKLDQFLVRDMLGQVQLGIYSVSVTLAEMLFLIPSSVGTAITGRLYNISDDAHEQRKITTALTVKYVFYITLIFSIGAIIFSPLIIWLYGEEYASSQLPTQILFIGIAFASIGKVSGGYFQSIGKPYIHTVIAFSIFMINFAFNIMLIPKWGINGAAIASTISYTVYGFIYLGMYIFKEKISAKHLLGITDIDKEIKSRVVKSIKARLAKR
ncbi:flippase [Clostridium senegalense]|uniref:flippase n=1 Tax=Clostridium senegalense TaxID=1465809 RepID=UPI0002889882|nr:flippase [Clostridium senegalense]